MLATDLVLRMVFIFFGGVYTILKHSFLRLETTKKGNTERKRKEKFSKNKSVSSALLSREM